jgi:hypothetical protein
LASGGHLANQAFNLAAHFGNALMTDQEQLQEIEEERSKQLILAITNAMNGVAQPEDWALICMECRLALVPTTTH